MNKMKRGSEQDDPYSDWWMLRIEDKLDQTKDHAAIAARTGGPGTGERACGSAWARTSTCSPSSCRCSSMRSSALPPSISGRLRRHRAQADPRHHTALIDRSTGRWLNEGAHALRSLFSLAQQYRYSGCTRDDFAAKNAAARARWRSSASCRRTCSKARAARRLRHPSCAVVCNSGENPAAAAPASMVMPPLLPTRPKAQPLRRAESADV
jgi:hypothetical protein